MAARPGRGVLLTFVAVVLAGGLAAVATQGPLYAAVAVVAAAYLVVVITVGARATGIAFMALAFASAPMYRGVEDLTGGIPPTDVFIIAAIIHLLPSFLGRPLRLPTIYLVGLLLMAVCSVVTVIVTGDLATNAFYAVQWLFFVGVLPVVVAWWRPGLGIVDWMLWSYLVGHLISTGKALSEGAVFADRYDGLTHHPNAFGVAGVVSIAIAMYLFHRHKGIRTRLLLAAFAATSLLSIMLSGSRAAIVVLVALILLVPVVERSALAGVGLAVATALGVMSLPFIVQVSSEESAIGRLAGGGTASGSDKIRTEALEDGIERFWTSPILGTGFDDVEVIHNVFVEAAVAIGALGLLAYVIVLFALARPLFTRHPQRRLTYLIWVFIGVAPSFPGLWDRTMWVPASLAALAMLRPDPPTQPAAPDVVPTRSGSRPAPLSPGRA